MSNEFKFCRIETIVTEFPLVFYTTYVVRCPELAALEESKAGSNQTGRFFFRNENAAVAFAKQQEQIEAARAAEAAKAAADADHFATYISNPVRSLLMRHVPGLTRDQIAVYGKLAPLTKLPEGVREAAASMGTWHVWDAKTSDGRIFRVNLDAISLANAVLQLI